jgi:hypothetical protein
MTSLDVPQQAWLDQEDRHTAELIRRFGVYIQYVGGERCTCCEAGTGGDVPKRPTDMESPFAYTVGLFGIGHPELLIVGADPGTSATVLNDVSRRIRGGGDLVAGELLTFDGWAHRVVVEVVPNAGEIAFAANRFYQRPREHSVPLLQLTYDDRHGHFPWEDGYSNPSWVQPRPGELRA